MNTNQKAFLFLIINIPFTLGLIGLSYFFFLGFSINSSDLAHFFKGIGHYLIIAISIIVGLIYLKVFGILKSTVVLLFFLELALIYGGVWVTLKN